MSAGVRLVLDTNIIVSALLWRGTPHELIAAARTRPVTLFTSPILLAELDDILACRKLMRPVAASGLTPDQLRQRYLRLAMVIHPAPIPPTVLADPDDDHVLACALAAKADYIVSGDRDLLTLKTFRELPIVTAAEAVRIVTTS